MKLFKLYSYNRYRIEIDKATKERKEEADGTGCINECGISIYVA